MNLKAINKQAQEAIRTAKKNEKPKQVFHYESEKKGLTVEEKQKLQEFLNSPEGQNLAPTVKQSVEDLLKGKTRVDNKTQARKQKSVFFDFDGEEEEEEAVNLPTQIGSFV